MVERNTPIKFCLASHLFNIIQDFPKDHLIIDTRLTQKYNELSIPNSLNLNQEFLISNKDKLPKLTSDQKKFTINAMHCKIAEKVKNLDVDEANTFIKKENKFAEAAEMTINFTSLLGIVSQDWQEKLQKCKRKYCVLIINHKDMLMDHIEPAIFYSATTSFHLHYFEKDQRTMEKIFEKIYLPCDPELSSIEFGLKLYDIFMAESIKELYIMVEGAEKFFKTYPFIEKSATNPTIKYPNDILQNKIFLGDGMQATNEHILRNLRITHIVNCAQEMSNMFSDGNLKYFKVPVTDETNAYISDYFKLAYEFIDLAFEENPENRILIHCKLGKSRSATITMMYLMKKFSWTYEQAYQYVKDKRNTICPNLGFVDQLQHFEELKCEFDIEMLQKDDENCVESCNQTEIEVPTSQRKLILILTKLIIIIANFTCQPYLTKILFTLFMARIIFLFHNMIVKYLHIST